MKTEYVVLDTISLSAYGLDGSVEMLIKQLQDFVDEAKERGLTNLRIDTNSMTEAGYGGEHGKEIWYAEIRADREIGSDA